LRFLLGTFAPFSRASLSPIAIACFRLRTFRPDPLLRVPFFFRCMADFTRLPAAFPYLAMRRQYAKRVLTADASGMWMRKHHRLAKQIAGYVARRAD
jgi:hypothetical protein